MRRDLFTEVAAILHPGTGDHTALDRERTAGRLEADWDEHERDPLLASLRAQPDRPLVRQLLAYGFEFTGRHPYATADLAGATGMAAADVRNGYDRRDIDLVAAVLGDRSKNTPDPVNPIEVAMIVDELEERAQPRHAGKALEVFRVVRRLGWTAYPPSSYEPNPRCHLRWKRSWPNGTTVTLYQDEQFLYASSRVAPDLAREWVADLTIELASTVHQALSRLADELTERDRAGTLR